MTRYECPTCDVVVQANPASYRATCQVCGATFSTARWVKGPRAKERLVKKPRSRFWSVVVWILELID